MRKRGIVKSYDPAAGIGFLENSDGEEFFVHRTGIIVRASHWNHRLWRLGVGEAG
jgi:cold shock CspA family protein